MGGVVAETYLNGDTAQGRVLIEKCGWPERLVDEDTMGRSPNVMKLLNEEDETTVDLDRGVDVVWT